MKTYFDFAFHISSFGFNITLYFAKMFTSIVCMIFISQSKTIPHYGIMRHCIQFDLLCYFPAHQLIEQLNRGKYEYICA